MPEKIIRFIQIWLSRSGDDTFWSWVITLAYLVTVILSFAHVRRIGDNRPLRFLWLFISFFVLLLGINKQLDVQILVMMVGRFCAAHLGLTQYRHVLYFALFFALFFLMLTGGVVLFIKTRSVLLRSKLPIGGVLVLMIFVLIRAGYIPVRRVHALELLGLLMILSGLLLSMRNGKRENDL